VTTSSCGAGATNSYTLRLDVASGSGTKYLSTQRTASWGSSQSWGFWMGRRSSSAATSSNISYMWLYASESDVTSSTVDGYRISFGDNSGNDEIVLERIDDGSSTAIVTSSGAVSNGLADIGFLVRVTRSTGSSWTLYTSTLPTSNGSGDVASAVPSSSNAATNQGSATDNTYTAFSNGYFGFAAKHSSGSAARTGAEFDQLYFDTSSDASLPVELSSFTAHQEKNDVVLKWITESEIENLGFILEKQINSLTQWNEIASYITHPELQGQGSVTHRTEYTFVDKDVVMGKHYEYRLSDVDYYGTKTSHPVRSVLVTPSRIALQKPWPNPFNPMSQFSIFVYEESPVSIKIIDSLGRDIKTILNKRFLSPGQYEFSWDGRTNSNETAGSGMYYVRFESDEEILSEKILLIR
tara:strand:+ start:830 stop:2059 length:1230 start_codon:yes stop_codon:yes gene_type:complete